MWKFPSKIRAVLLIVGVLVTSITIAKPASAAVPVCSSASISGGAFIGGTLTATPVCTNSPTSYTYQWSRSATSGGTYTNISLATNSTYVPVAGDANYFLKVSVRGVNADGTSSAVLSSASSRIVNLSDSDSDGKPEITTCNELFTELISATNSYEIVVAGGTLDCTGVTQTPITGFTGSLNGNGSTITNINISCTTPSCAIFGYVNPSSSPSVIENFTANSPTVTSSKSRVAVVVAAGGGAGVTLDNITISGGTVSSTGTTTDGYYVGSLLGYDPKGVITDSSSSATVTGTNYTGGIAGALGDQNTSCSSSRPYASNNTFSGSVTGYSYVGGIAGAFEPNNGGTSCKIISSTNSGSVASTGNSASCLTGGIAGQLWESRIESSSNSGSVNQGSCTSQVGGIVGYMRGNSGIAVGLDGVWNTGTIGTGSGTVGGVAGLCEGYSSATITRSFNIGTINGGSGSGGLAGSAGCAISNSFSYSTVSASGGALIGYSYSNGATKSYAVSSSRKFIDSYTSSTCTGSFWDNTIGSALVTNCSGATGKSTSLMKQLSTFTAASWDFVNETANGTDDYWVIDSTVNDGYPFINNVGVSALSGGSAWLGSDSTAPSSSGSITETATNSTSFNVSYSATDAVGVSSVTAYYSSNSNLSSPTSCGSATGLSGTSASGTISCTISSSVNLTTYYIYTRATDSSNNTESAPGSADDSVYYDTTPSTATWTPPSSPSSSRTLSYTLAFSESVSGIASGDFSNASGTASSCTFTPSASSGTTITVSVSCSSDGTIIVRLAANAISDAAGNSGPLFNADASSVTIDTSATTTSTSSTTTTSTTSTTSTTTTSTIAPVSITTTTSTSSSTTSTTVPLGSVGINSWTISSSANPATPGSRIVLTTTISCGKQMSTTAAPYYPSMYYMVSSSPWINGVYGRPSLSTDRRTATFTVTVTAPSTAGSYQMYAYGRDNPFGGTCTGNSYNFSVSPRFTLVVGSGATTSSSTSIAEVSSTTSSTALQTPTAISVPLGQVGINSWTIASSANPARPGQSIVLTTIISCGRQMSTNATPYYPSMYYMVRSTPWINGVYRGPTLSADRRTATFTVSVTAPTTPGIYTMYAYGRDNPFGGTCTGDSYNFANTAMFKLTVGNVEETTTTVSELSTTTSAATIPVLPTITTTSTTTPTTTSTTSSTSSSVVVSASSSPASTNPAPVVQLDVTTAIRLPENTQDFVVTRDSLIAIVDNLQITRGIIRIKTANGAWTETDIANISDIVLPLGDNSDALEIEVLEEGSTTPISYTVPITRTNSGNPWAWQLAIAALGVSAIWFFIFAVRRRREDQQS